MPRKKIDNRLRVLIENGIQNGHRTLLIVVGDNGKYQIPVLHHILANAAVRARPAILWCYKKELGFSSYKKKRMKQVQKKIKSGSVNLNDDDPFELFISSTTIRYCYYSDTQKILGNTYGMCVLQDFEALTPNLLARTIETVEGGGIIVMLLRSMSSLKQLYTMAMDVHDRYRSEAHHDVVARFNERFLLSLSTCKRCIVADDELKVLPVSSHIIDMTTISVPCKLETDLDLLTVQEAFRETSVGGLLQCCKTSDQAKALMSFVDALSTKSLRCTVSLTAARGRGKSATLGLAVAAAVSLHYANIFVTSPSPENLKTFFEFLFKGLDFLGYKEHVDYGLVQSSDPEHNKALVRVNIFQEHRQTVQYINPSEANQLSQAELLVIDEAAAIPLPLVKSLLGNFLVFLSSTINGYEGTGRSLSLKLLEQLRNQCSEPGNNAKSDLSQLSGRTLKEVILEQSIRYKSGDDVEQWLNHLLCLDASNITTTGRIGTPPPHECELFYVNRDALFCYHNVSEAFLQQLMALFVASHYKNSPNDLQMMSDAPAHHIFCLLSTNHHRSEKVPEILCAIQVCLEGQIAKHIASDALLRGKKAAGDLIPWTVSQQFLDENFPALSGVRIVRIATHPDCQGMGYGTRAIALLKEYYGTDFPFIEDTSRRKKIKSEPTDTDIYSETIQPRLVVPPLLLKLVERRAEKLDYMGVSYGLTLPLLKFWKRGGFIPVYVRQTANDLTAEHSCIMLTPLNNQKNASWLPQYWEDFLRRFITLLSYKFRTFPTSLALSVLMSSNYDKASKCHALDITELDTYLTKYDLKRIEVYCSNGVDYHLIMDLMPPLARLFFENKFGSTTLSSLQRAILLGMGLQHKNIDDLASELGISPSQILGIYDKMMRKLQSYIRSVIEGAIEKDIVINEPSTSMDNAPALESMNDELENASKAIKKKQKRELKRLKKDISHEFAIKGTDDEWNKALKLRKTTMISIKSGEKVSDIASGSSKTVKPASEGSKKRKKQKEKKGWKKQKR